jgi:hypothetical protein
VKLACWPNAKLAGPLANFFNGASAVLPESSTAEKGLFQHNRSKDGVSRRLRLSFE